ncbi:MAG: SRPBCC family protein [Gammaproteobacteria bacterium]|nr:SRPBCC family protein [Gammaproteobacteria bacterium]
MNPLIVTQFIGASAEAVWSAITDFEHCDRRISGITRVEVLHRPSSGELVGLVWRETRLMYGKEATEEMRIVESVEGEYYVAEASNHGALYRSKFSVKPTTHGCDLSMSFEAEAQTWFAKIMNVIFSRMMRKSLLTMIEKDLADIAKSVELDRSGRMRDTRSENSEI